MLTLEGKGTVQNGARGIKIKLGPRREQLTGANSSISVCVLHVCVCWGSCWKPGEQYAVQILEVLHELQS